MAKRIKCFEIDDIEAFYGCMCAIAEQVSDETGDTHVRAFEQILTDDSATAAIRAYFADKSGVVGKLNTQHRLFYGGLIPQYLTPLGSPCFPVRAILRFQRWLAEDISCETPLLNSTKLLTDPSQIRFDFVTWYALSDEGRDDGRSALGQKVKEELVAKGALPADWK